MTALALSPRPQLAERRRDTLLLLAVVVTAAAAGYLIVQDPLATAGVALIPLVLWLFTQRRVSIVLLALCIPLAQDVTRGRVGVNIALSDLLMMLLLASAAAEALARRQVALLAGLGDLGGAVLQYLACMAVLLALHLSPGTLLKTGQRLELLVVPIVVGALIAQEGCERLFLRMYIVSAAILSLAWPFIVSGDQGLGIQKNPAGQFIANAILVLLAVPAVRNWAFLLLTPVLVLGLFLTESRGAIVSVGAGLGALVVLQPGRSRLQLLLQLPPLTAVTALAFRLLPESTQKRNTSFTTGTATTAEYALKIRQQYRHDAWQIIHAHPWSGVGVGQYHAGSMRLRTISTDPHQVLLFQAAEGGYLFAVSFVVLILGTVAALARRVGSSSLAPAAAAVLLAIAVHGMFDVYWVRATPVLGWLLVGMAFSESRRDRRS